MVDPIITIPNDKALNTRNILVYLHSQFLKAKDPEHPLFLRMVKADANAAATHKEIADLPDPSQLLGAIRSISTKFRAADAGQIAKPFEEAVRKANSCPADQQELIEKYNAYLEAQHKESSRLMTIPNLPITKEVAQLEAEQAKRKDEIEKEKRDREKTITQLEKLYIAYFNSLPEDKKFGVLHPEKVKELGVTAVTEEATPRQRLG